MRRNTSRFNRHIGGRKRTRRRDEICKEQTKKRAWSRRHSGRRGRWELCTLVKDGSNCQDGQSSISIINGSGSRKVILPKFYTDHIQ